jgi:guanylate kinase
LPSFNKPLFLVTGGSGVGKNAVITELIKQYPQLEFIVSATTRWPARSKEKFAKNYYFVSQACFDWLHATNQLVESTQVYGDCYGTLAVSLESALNAQKTPILTVDPEGIENYRRLGYTLHIVYLDFPNAQAQRQRIIDRQPDIATQTLDERLAEAAEERAWASEQSQADDFHIIVNDKLGVCIADVARVLDL